MPVSKKRKLTRGQKIKGAIKRAATYAANKDKVMPIYALAFPERQEYQPFDYEPPKRAERKVSTPIPLPPPNSMVTHRNGREYKVTYDGSFLAQNKPRSRVKRFRDERRARVTACKSSDAQTSGGALT